MNRVGDFVGDRLRIAPAEKHGNCVLDVDLFKPAPPNIDIHDFLTRDDEDDTRGVRKCKPEDLTF